MASSSTSVAPTRPPSIFDFPELVELVSQYLSSHDIVQCMATSKAFTHQFEPFLWRNVVLNTSLPAPQSLAHHRHRIRSLNASGHDYANLRTITNGLPDLIPLNGSHNPVITTGSLQEPCSSTNNLSVTNNNVFYRLRSLHIDFSWLALKLDGFDRTIRILHQSPNLTYMILPAGVLTNEYSSILAQNFLHILANRLPLVEKLTLRGYFVDREVGFEFLRVCLNHPRLTDLNCNFRISDAYTYVLDSFLASLEDDKDKAASDKPVMGYRIKNLRLPESPEGYTLGFICTLLRSHFPNLERFHIPRLDSDEDEDDDDDEDMVDSIMEAVAKGCPKLQHISCLSLIDIMGVEKIINGVIMGCKHWGLKTFSGLRFNDIDELWQNRCILETLVDYHSETLEEVELEACAWIRSCDLANIFRKCKHLRRIKIEPMALDKPVTLNNLTARAPLNFEDVVSEAWACYDLKELQLVLSRPRFNLEEEYSKLREEEYESDHDGDSDAYDGSDDRLIDRYDARVRRMAKEVYGQIGRLVKLETLCLGGLGYEKPVSPMEGFEYDMTLSNGWLTELAGLKELKHFAITTDLWSRMGQAEVEFMDAHWPKLKKISFGYFHPGHIIKEPHWKWLQERRPHLKYSELRRQKTFYSVTE